MTKITPVVAYPRASSLSQLDGFGLEAQERTIREYCERNDMAIHRIGDKDAVFAERAVRGKTEYEDREAFVEMLAYIEKHDIKHVIVAKLDRLARDLIVQETIIRDLTRLGVKLVSVAEPDLNSDDETRILFRRIVGAISEWDAIRIAKRMKSGRIERAYKGERAVGRIPFGYRSVEDSRGKPSTVVDHEQARIVKRIFALRSDGLSQEVIANELNAAGVPGPTGKTWHQSAISTILRNPIYGGVIRSHAAGDGSPPIVSSNDSLCLV